MGVQFNQQKQRMERKCHVTHWDLSCICIICILNMVTFTFKGNSPSTRKFNVTWGLAEHSNIWTKAILPEEDFCKFPFQ